MLVTTRPADYTERYSEPDKRPAGRGDSFDAWPVPYWWVDAGAVVQNLLLLVAANGLGACLFGPFDHEPALREEFAIDEERRIVATVAVGPPPPRRTRPFGEPRP